LFPNIAIKVPPRAAWYQQGKKEILPLRISVSLPERIARVFPVSVALNAGKGLRASIRAWLMSMTVDASMNPICRSMLRIASPGFPDSLKPQGL
jgi:hypothetical protein